MKSRSVSIALRPRTAWPDLATTAYAQSDTRRTSRSLFTWRDGVLAGGLRRRHVRDPAARQERRCRAAGADSADRARSFRKRRPSLRTIAVPGSVVIGVSMYAVGRLAQQRAARRGRAARHGSAVRRRRRGEHHEGRVRPRTSVRRHDQPESRRLAVAARISHRRSATARFRRDTPSPAFAAAAAVSAETSRWWPNATYFSSAR